MKFIDKVKQYKEMLSQKKLAKQGVIDPRGTIPNPETPLKKQSFGERAVNYFGNALQKFGNYKADKIQQGISTLRQQLPIHAQAQPAQPVQKRYSLSEWNKLGTPVIKSTNTPMPTPTPFIPNRIEPIQPMDKNTEPARYTVTGERGINESLWNTIINSGMDDEQKRLAFALAFQESSGGKNPVGDKGRSFGPYHIMPIYHPLTKEEALDENKSTDYLKEWMNKRKSKGVGFKEMLRQWNSKSGYVNKGPRYDVELPQTATMSAFYRR